MLALDGSVSPYLPTKEILAAIETAVEAALTPAILARMLRDRLALLHGISPERIALFPHDERRFERLAAICPNAPWVAYPPGSASLGTFPGSMETFEIERSYRFRIETEQIAATPPGSISMVMRGFPPNTTIEIWANMGRSPH